MTVEAMAPTSNMPRPRPYAPGIVRVAAQRIAEECMEWDPTSKPEHWVEALVDSVRDWSDGYRLARQLEIHSSVSPDSGLVEVLDGAYHHLECAQEEAENIWVRIVGFTPEHAVGDLVVFAHGTGPIHSIDMKRARYVVDVERTGNGGIYANAEDVAAA